MNKNNLIKGDILFKPLLVLLFCLALLLLIAAFSTNNAKAATITPTREVELPVSSNVTVNDGEILRVYENIDSGWNAAGGVIVPKGVKATVILENIRRGSAEWNTTFFQAMENTEVTVLIKGKNQISTNKNYESCFLMKNGAKVTIEDYGNGDGILDLAQAGSPKFASPTLGMSSGEGFLTINSGKVVATSRNDAPAIGAGVGSTLNLTINDPAVVEAHTQGRGAAIGTPGWIQDISTGRLGDAAVNATINGGTVIADNYYSTVTDGKYLSGAVIGVGNPGPYKGTVILNIPETSTAKLQLTNYGGGAAIGGYGEINTNDERVNRGFQGVSSNNVTANIAGGTTDITVRGQGPGIGCGASIDYDQNVTANISGGDINIHNDLYESNLYASNTTGPSIGVGMFSQYRTVTCNISGGNVHMLSQDQDDKGYNATAPAVGISVVNKNDATRSKWTQAKGNTVNFNVSGGNVSAETRSADESLLDVGVLANNTLNVKVDGGSFDVVNQRMGVTAKDSEDRDVYPATVSLGSRTDSIPVEKVSVDGKDYGKDLTTQSGKLCLWTAPGENKEITASIASDAKAYTNPAVNLAYEKDFTFTEPNVSLKKTVAPAELGSMSVKGIGEDNVTIQVQGTTDAVPIAIQAYEHGTSTAVGKPQAYEAGKTDYTFSGLKKNKVYDIKTIANDAANYWPAESEALVVKPFAYAPALPNAVLKGAYDGSVAAEGGTYTYALADGAVLPEGLNFNEQGSIKGQATETGDFSFEVTATASDEGLAAGNSRTAAVTLKVVPIMATSLIVDELGQPLENCGCSIEIKSAKEEIGVGDTVAYTVTPCPLHDFVKLNLNGNDITSGTSTSGNTIKYSYTVKSGDTKLEMKAFMTESDLKITELEKADAASNLEVYANDENNKNAELLKNYVAENTILKATYNTGETKTGKASELGIGWATNDAYNIKGGTYHYTINSGDASVEQTLTVKSVNVTLGTLKDITLRTNAEGYPSIEALGLPETIGCQYPAGVTVDEATREAAIDWTTEVPENFGKTVTEEPVVFEGTVAVPEWATITDNTVSVNVNITDKVVLVPVITIEDKTYDGTKTAVIEGTPALDPEALTEGTDVQLAGDSAVAEFSAVDAGNNIPVNVSGLSLTGEDAGKYSLDLSQVTGNIIKAIPAAPAKPVLKESTTESITLETIEVTDAMAVKAGATVEYGIIDAENETKWQAEPVFKGLKGDTAYRFTARYAATNNTEASAESEILDVKTSSDGLVIKAPTVVGVPEGTEGIVVAADKEGEAVKAGEDVTFTLTGNKAKEGSYVPYGFTINGEAVACGKIDKATRSCQVTYTVQDADVEKGSIEAEALYTRLGNINTDDKINAGDALLVQRSAASLGNPLSAEKLVAADVNMDGRVNAGDALLIKRFAAGVDEAL